MAAQLHHVWRHSHLGNKALGEKGPVPVGKLGWELDAAEVGGAKEMGPDCGVSMTGIIPNSINFLHY